MKQPKDMSGRYGKWNVLKEVTTDKAGRHFECKCECGTVKIVRHDGLARAKKLDIGCTHCAVRYKKHGDTGTRLHQIWMGMINRCRFKKGYTGITRCKEWDDFVVFKDWALSNGYNDTLTIDRIDYKGNYEPDNCRWTTQQTQCENTRLLFSTNTSGYRGVGFHKKSNTWRAYIKVHNKQVHLGVYSTKEEAALAYDNYVISKGYSERPLNILTRD